MKLQFKSVRPDMSHPAYQTTSSLSATWGKGGAQQRGNQGAAANEGGHNAQLAERHLGSLTQTALQRKRKYNYEFCHIQSLSTRGPVTLTAKDVNPISSFELRNSFHCFPTLICDPHNKPADHQYEDIFIKHKFVVITSNTVLSIITQVYIYPSVSMH